MCISAKRGCSYHPKCCCITSLQSWSLMFSFYGACWSCCISQILLVVRQHIAFACRMLMPSERNYNLFCIHNWRRMLWSWSSMFIYFTNTFLDVAVSWLLKISFCCSFRSKERNSFAGCHMTSTLVHCYDVEFKLITKEWAVKSEHGESDGWASPTV